MSASCSTNWSKTGHVVTPGRRMAIGTLCAESGAGFCDGQRRRGVTAKLNGPPAARRSTRRRAPQRLLVVGVSLVAVHPEAGCGGGVAVAASRSAGTVAAAAEVAGRGPFGRAIVPAFRPSNWITTVLRRCVSEARLGLVAIVD